MDLALASSVLGCHPINDGEWGNAAITHKAATAALFAAARPLVTANEHGRVAHSFPSRLASPQPGLPDKAA
ncbi:MAG: hypothetical protein ACJ8AI_02495 [Rhodopila sp.]